MKKAAYVTLLTSDSYIQGAISLAHSLRLVNSKYSLVCMATKDVSNTLLSELYKPNALFDEIIQVDTLNSQDSENLELLGRPELGVTFTKINAWNLTQYKYVVFLDSDTLVLKNIDELFEVAQKMDDNANGSDSSKVFAAAPDVGWPDHFNSGVFLCKPDREVFESLIEFANTKGSFDGGDQGLLNRYFNDWLNLPHGRLSFTFNVTPSAYYSYAPAYKENMDNIRVVHFIGNNKPWWMTNNNINSHVLSKSSDDTSSDQFQCLVNKWWDVYMNYMKSLRNDSELPNENYSSSNIINDNITSNNENGIPVIVDGNGNNQTYLISNHPYDNAWITKQIQKPVITTEKEEVITQFENNDNIDNNTIITENVNTNNNISTESTSQEQQQQQEVQPKESSPSEPLQQETEVSVKTNEIVHPTDNAWLTNKIITQDEIEKRNKVMAKISENTHPTDNAWKTNLIITRDDLLNNAEQITSLILQEEEDEDQMERPWDPAVIAASMSKSNQNDDDDDIKVLSVVENNSQVDVNETKRTNVSATHQKTKRYSSSNSVSESYTSEIENFSNYRIDWNLNDLRGFKRHMKNILKRNKASDDDIKHVEQLPGVHVSEIFSNDNNENEKYNTSTTENEEVEEIDEDENYNTEGNKSRSSIYSDIKSNTDIESNNSNNNKADIIDLDNYDVYGFNYQNQLRRKSISRDSTYSNSSGGKRRKSIVEVLSEYDMYPINYNQSFSNSNNDNVVEEPIDFTGIIENNFEEDLFIDEDEIENLSFVKHHSMSNISNSGYLDNEDEMDDDTDNSNNEINDSLLKNGLIVEEEIIIKSDSVSNDDGNDEIVVVEEKKENTKKINRSEEITHKTKTVQDNKKEEEKEIVKPDEPVNDDNDKKEEGEEKILDQSNEINNANKKIKENIAAYKEEVMEFYDNDKNNENDGYFAEELIERKNENVLISHVKEEEDKVMVIESTNVQNEQKCEEVKVDEKKINDSKQLTTKTENEEIEIEKKTEEHSETKVEKANIINENASSGKDDKEIKTSAEIVTSTTEAETPIPVTDNVKSEKMESKEEDKKEQSNESSLVKEEETKMDSKNIQVETEKEEIKKEEDKKIQTDNEEKVEKENKTIQTSIANETVEEKTQHRQSVMFKESEISFEKSRIHNEDSTLIQDISTTSMFDNEKSEIIEEDTEKSEEIIVIPRKRTSKKMAKEKSTSSSETTTSKGMYYKIPFLASDENVVLDSIRLFGRQASLLSKFEETTYSYYNDTINAAQYHDKYIEIISELCKVNSTDARFASMDTLFLNQSSENLWGSIANGFLKENENQKDEKSESKDKENENENEDEDKTLVENISRRKSHRFSILRFGSRKRNSKQEKEKEKEKEKKRNSKQEKKRNSKQEKKRNSKFFEINRRSRSQRSSYYNVMDKQKIDENNKHQKEMLNEWCQYHKVKLQEKMNPTLSEASTSEKSTENITTTTTEATTEKNIEAVTEEVTETEPIKEEIIEQKEEENIENKTTLTVAKDSDKTTTTATIESTTEVKVIAESSTEEAKPATEVITESSTTEATKATTEVITESSTEAAKTSAEVITETSTEAAKTSAEVITESSLKTTTAVSTTETTTTTTKTTITSNIKKSKTKKSKESKQKKSSKKSKSVKSNETETDINHSTSLSKSNTVEKKKKKWWKRL